MSRRPLVAGAILSLVSLDQFLKHALPGSQQAGHVPMPVAGLIAVSAAYLLYKANISRITAIGLLFLCAGASSNLIDRFIFQAIIDPFKVSNLVFNLADIYIVAGTAAIVTGILTIGKTPS